MNQVRQFVKRAALGALGLWAAALPVSVASAAPPAAAAPAASDIPAVLDAASLTKSESDALKNLLNRLQSPCGKSQSLGTSIRSDPKCSVAVVAGKWLVKQLGDGYLESEAEEHYQARFMGKVFTINTEGAAVRGDPKAPIALVEFSDFECPHCRGMEAPLKQLLEENKDVKLVFMNFPLSGHPNAANGAAAAVAAGKQGKFWAFHDKLFENQERMKMTDILRYAQELKLDIPKFQADMETSRKRVADERAVGVSLDLRFTPTLYMNGRLIETTKSMDELRSYVEAERARVRDGAK